MTRSDWSQIFCLFACKLLKTDRNIIPFWEMAPQGANSQVLTCESIWFGGNEEDALNVKNNDKRFIFLTLSNFLVKMQFN